MLNDDVENPAVQEHVGGELPNPQNRTTANGTSPSIGVSAGTASVAMNITTFAAMSAFNAVDTGPGPKENDEAYGRWVTAHCAEPGIVSTAGRPTIAGRALWTRPERSNARSAPAAIRGVLHHCAGRERHRRMSTSRAASNCRMRKSFAVAASTASAARMAAPTRAA